VFARLYISQVSLFEQDPGEAIASAIGKHVFVPSRGFKWCIADAQPGPERVVLGRLARIKHETGTTRGFDERHWSIVTERPSRSTWIAWPSRLKRHGPYAPPFSATASPT
jgi:hypothetical protein